jgi:hypothetical protein
MDDTEALQRKVDLLLERVADLERQSPLAPDRPSRRATRRQALSAAALAGVGAALAGHRSAAAANNQPLLMGQVTNTASLPTGLAVTGSDQPYGLGVTDNGLGVVPISASQGAVFGHANETAFVAGVIGYGQGAATASKFFSDTGTAVLAESVTTGDCVAAIAYQGVGGSFTGSKGAIRLGVSGNVRSKAGGLGILDCNADGGLWWASGAGVWQQVAGPGTAGAFHPLTPGRVFDSRVPLPSTGPLPVGGTRSVAVADRRDLASGAVVEANFVPEGAAAVSANVTVVNTAGSGFLVANPGGVPTVGAATINWFASGQVLNNGVILKLGTGANERKLTLVAGGGTGASTDVVIDITGYWL